MLFIGRKLTSLGNTVPFFKAAPTAAGTGVLGDEYGVPTHGSLLAVIGYRSRSKALGDKIFSMAVDNVHALFPHIFPVLLGQMKFSPESRLLQLVKSFIYSLHLYDLL